SSSVQALPSSQVAPGVATCTHSPVAGSQESVVHWFWSSQERGVPWQTGPPAVVGTHLSSSVQALPSSQVAPGVATCMHSPVAGSQESVVHWFWSSQERGVPWQTGPPAVVGTHLSSSVQALPSSPVAQGMATV